MSEPHRDIAPFDRDANVVALISTLELRREVRHALAKHRVSYCSVPNDAKRELKRTGARMLVAQVRSGSRESLLALLDYLQDNAPRLIVAVCAEERDTPSRHVMDVLRHPLTEVVTINREMSEHLSLLAEASSSAFVRSRRADHIARIVGGRRGAGAGFIVEQGHRPQQCFAVGARLGVSESTVLRSFEEAGMTTEKVIAYGRVIAAAIELEGSLLTVERVAYALEFASSSALCTQVKSCAGVTPTHIRKTGGSEWLTAELIRKLSLQA